MRRYLIFAVGSVAILFSAINATAVSVAFPVITSSFNTSLIIAGWVMSAYQLALVATIPLSGKISDVLGRKVTFLGFLSLFIVGSVLCSFAPNVPSLIVARLIQGVGGSGFIPSATGMVADDFPKSRQKAVGLLSSILPIGWIVGPNLGGWMVTVFGWRSVFWINVPLCVIALAAAAILLPGDRPRKSHIDPVGSLLLVGALAGLMSGISEMGSTDTRPPWALVGLLLGAGTASLIFFCRRQNRVKYPVIEPEVLTGRPFLAANIYNFVFGCVLGAIVLIPLYAVSIYGMSTLESGLVLTPRSVGMIALSTVTSLCLVRWGYRRPLLIANLCVIPGLILLGLEPASRSILGLSSTAFLLAVMGLLGVAQGMMSPAANNACIELMPHRVATITAMRSMFRQAGQLFTITVGTLVLHNLGIERGFQFFFFGLAAITALILTPAIFAMPRSPADVPEETTST